MKRFYAVLSLSILIASRAFAIGPAKLAGVDLFGSERISNGEINAKFGDKIKSYFEKKGSRYPKEQKIAARLIKDLEDSVRKEWDLHWVRLTWMDSYSVEDHNVYITFDVVEKNDVKTRMPFTAPPKKSFSDPNSLIALWSQYSELGWSQVRTGHISSDRPPCPAVYCLWGSQTPELKALEDRIIQLAPASKDVLIQIAADDKDPVHRANAVYLLAYTNDTGSYPRILQNALKDPEMEVRAAALRVYSDLAVYQKQTRLPIEQIGAVLDYPTVEDRNKALAVVTAMADNPLYREYLIRRGAPLALKLLRSIQPSNHDLAYSVLGILSKQNFGQRDYSAWQQWISQAQAKLDAELKKKR